VSAWRRDYEIARARRRTYLDHVYACRRGCNRAERRYCAGGALLRERYEGAVGMQAVSSGAAA
jgi:hypothetical protein